MFLDAHAAGRTPALPAVCLIVSGGHTILYHVKSESSNGAPHFPTPASAARATMPPAKLTTKSRECSRWAIPAARSSTSLPRTATRAPSASPSRKCKGNPYDFSFSGIKTALLYHLKRNPQLQPEIEARAARRWRAANAKRMQLRALLHAADARSDRQLPACCRLTTW